MGQPNGKESRAGKASASGLAPPRTNAVGVRSFPVRDALVPLEKATHRDPMSELSVSAQAPRGNPSGAAPTAGRNFPVVLRYADKDAKALLAKKQKLFVVVESLDWKPMPMTPSEDSFYAILDLPPGAHRYRFVLDGKEVVDSTQPLADARSDAAKEMPANILRLNDVLLTTKEDDDIMDDGDGWGQEQVMFEESRKYPPIVPLHLRYTPLNTPPTAVRCARDGTMSAAGESVAPEHLPLPLNVTINHVYFQRREDHSVVGVTTRYCNKYTTVVYYSTLGAPGVQVSG